MLQRMLRYNPKWKIGWKCYNVVSLGMHIGKYWQGKVCLNYK